MGGQWTCGVAGTVGTGVRDGERERVAGDWVQRFPAACLKLQGASQAQGEGEGAVGARSSAQGRAGRQAGPSREPSGRGMRQDAQEAARVARGGAVRLDDWQCSAALCVVARVQERGALHGAERGGLHGALHGAEHECRSATWQHGRVRSGRRESGISVGIGGEEMEGSMDGVATGIMGDTEPCGKCVLEQQGEG